MKRLLSFGLFCLLTACVPAFDTPEAYIVEITMREVERVTNTAIGLAALPNTSAGWRVVQGGREEATLGLELLNRGCNDFTGNFPCLEDRGSGSYVVGSFQVTLLTYEEPTRLLLAASGAGKEFRRTFLTVLRRDYTAVPTSWLP